MIRKQNLLDASGLALLGAGFGLGAAAFAAIEGAYPQMAVGLVSAVAAATAFGVTRQRRGVGMANDLAIHALDAMADEVWVIDSTCEKVHHFNGAARARLGLTGQSAEQVAFSRVLSDTQLDMLRGFLAQSTDITAPVLTFGARKMRPMIHPLPHGELHMLVLRDVTRDLQEDQAKSDFISTVSHELRSPLTSIKGSMGLLLSNAAGELPKPARGLLDIAHRNAERLVLIINDILDLQKIVDGGMEFQTQDVDAAGLIHEAIAASSLLFQRFDLSIEVAGADAPVLFASDPNRLIQVLGNLLTNAAKFSKPHGTIRIALHHTPDSITIEVRDQGAGIPMHEQCKIFERFADMSNSDRQQKGGSGLGLSICKAIVDNLGGKIGFESTEGLGTTFSIQLPRQLVSDAQMHENTRNIA